MAIRDRNPAEVQVVAPVSTAQSPPRQVARDAQPGAGREDATTVPIEGVSARLVARMNESLAVPTATSFREIDVATLEAERSRLDAALAPRKLSYTHLLAFAVAQAVAVHQEMAAFYREIDGRPHRVEPARVGLGLAVDVEQRDGSRFLVAPVIAGADDLSFPEFVAAYDDLVERARTVRLAPDDLAGGTVTLTNPGTLGTTASVPRLLAGQGTIVATGAIRHVGGHTVMTISSTYDHRVIQGAQSGLFLGTIDELLQGADGFYDYIADSLGLSTPATASTGTDLAPASAAALAKPSAAMATADTATATATAELGPQPPPLEKEIDYLLSRGYLMSPDGWKLIAP